MLSIRRTLCAFLSALLALALLGSCAKQPDSAPSSDVSTTVVAADPTTASAISTATTDIPTATAPVPIDASSALEAYRMVLQNEATFFSVTGTMSPPGSNLTLTQWIQ
ncbi:MAG: hypothetical protein FWF49_05350, partial [Oscillospiraceae bacterium]|nr:hypothetical protein [Oscillospiraceae bacterium]